MRHDRWKSIGVCLIHLIPSTITSVLLFLNFSNVYYEAVGASNQSARLNALQFAAKMHEILIASSLSAIVLKHVQYELLQGGGVTLGSLLAGFQVTDVSSLWSPGLWATVYASSLKTRRFRLVILVIVMVLLGAVVGPASAILMLPSVDWWSYQPTENCCVSNINNPRYFVSANQSTLWPTYINAASFPLDCNYPVVETAPVYCPLGGFLSISSVFDLEHSAWVLNSSWNFTTQTLGTADSTYNRYVEGATVLGGWVDYLVPSLSQTTPLFADDLLVAINEWSGQADHNVKWSLSMPKGSQLLAPAIYTTCRTMGYEWWNGSLYEVVGVQADPAETQPYELPGDPLSQLTFPLDGNQTRSSDASPLLAIWNNSTESATLWVAPPDIGELSPSIGVVFAAFFNSSDQSFRYSAKVVTCSLFAYWQPVEIYIGPFPDTFIHSPSIDYPNAVVENRGYLADKTVRAIKFDIDWANSALPPNATVGQLATKVMNDPQPTDAVNVDMGFYTSGWNLPLGIPVSIFFADVLSRIGMKTEKMVGPTDDNSSTFDNIGSIGGGLFINNNIVSVSLSQFSLDHNTTEFRATLLRYGYSYSMSGLTRRLAAGILLTHVLIAVVCMILFIRSGWNYRGLQSICEVVVLAINSPPTETSESTCAGISRLDTYKHIVKVGEISETQLGFVFDDNGGFKAPLAGKKYGRVMDQRSSVAEQSGSELSALIGNERMRSSDAGEVLSLRNVQL